ncbi:MAG: class I SAM-dependent methyltransferase [Firmicutes bacterium]|nr:class I SAM-dependent methyltransferase [Bacillota bacterium]
MKQTCSICLSQDLTSIRIIKSPYTFDDYTLYECGTCHSRVFDIEEHPFDIDAFYNSRPESRENLQPDFTLSPYWLHETKLIKKTFGGRPGSILDVGCRTGDFLLHWPQDITRFGVELSAQSASVAAGRGLHVIQESVEKIEFDRKFDVVTCYAILEHLSEPRKFLEKIAGLVNDHGVLVIEIPSYQTLKARILERLRVRWHMYCPPEHLNLYSRSFLDHYFALQGFSLQKRSYTSGGMFNPFARVPVLRSVWSRLMWWRDAYSPLNRLPIFDHMYSYYVKRR